MTSRLNHPPGWAGPVSLYIHIPWCRSRCGYCDFNTFVPAGPDQISDYVAALLGELAQASRELAAHTVETIYFGGGTPTLMASADFRRILDLIRQRFSLDQDAEITAEANPETLDPGSLSDLREAGINRLSMGMQSAVPHVLATLDRVHTPGRVVEAACWARAAGFANLSLDLIYGSAGESTSDWVESLEAAVSIEPDHISAYSLIVEPSTPLARRIAKGESPVPDDDDLADKYLLADELLTAAGFEWYEVSNWARPGHECRHNLVYWHSGAWWGIGAGAHSHLAPRRWWNQTHPSSYRAAVERGASPMMGCEVLTELERHREAIMLQIRLASGLDRRLLSEKGLARAQDYVESGHLEPKGTRLICTVAGRLIADGITRELAD